MKKTVKFLSIVLILALLFPAVFAYAADDPVDQVVLAKTVTKKDTQVLYPNIDFTFLFTSIDVTSAPAGGNVKVTKAAALANQTISFKADRDSTDTSAITKDITQTVKDAIATNLPNADGTYAWTVSEQKGSVTDPEHMVFDKDSYLLVAYAEGTDSETPLYTFSVWHENKEQAQWEKVEKLAFTNDYDKQIIPDDSTLADVTITNNVLRQDETTHIPGVPFTYRISIGTVDGSEFPSDHYSYSVNGGETKTQAYNAPLVFELQDGQSIVINDLYEGAVLSVEEDGQAGYTPEATYGDYASKESKTVTAKKGEDIIVSGFRVPNNGGKAVFTNVKDDSTPTQFMIDNLPFAALIAVSLCGLVLYVVIRRRKRSHEA